jgi:hypothetical protein
MKKILLAFLFLITLPVTSAEIKCIKPTLSAVIYFGNGIKTDFRSAKSSLTELKVELGFVYNSHNLDYKTAYNETGGMTADLLEATAQSGTQNNRNIMRWLNGKNSAPEWFLKWFEKYSTDKSIQIAQAGVNHAKFYLNDILDGKKVIVVSHSQGNFYANEAKELLASQLRNGKMSSFALFGVAVPANSIGGNSGPYLTNHRDFIQKVPFSLPANWKLHYSDRKVADDVGAIKAHSFNATYLSEDFDIKPALISGIRAQIDAAAQPTHSCENYNQIVSSLVAGEYINTCDIGPDKVNKQFSITSRAVILSDERFADTSGLETMLSLSQQREAGPNVIQFGAFGNKSNPALGAAWGEDGLFRSGRPPLSCYVDEKTPQSWIRQSFNITKTMLAPLQGLYRILPKYACLYDRDLKNDLPVIFSIDDSSIRLGNHVWQISSDSESIFTYDFSFVSQSQSETPGPYSNPGPYSDPGFLSSFENGKYSFSIFYNRNREISRFTAVEIDKSTVSCDFL